MTKHGLTNLERFLLRVNKTAAGGCWLWTGWLGRGGYGSFGFYGETRREKAHRAAYKLLVSDIPAGQSVLHRCDNPACVNPAHLFLGTHADNMADMRKKGRGRSLPGEKSPVAKLTWADVAAIRDAHAAGAATCRELAARFNVSAANISSIIAGRTWAHNRAKLTPPRTGGGRPACKLSTADQATIKALYTAGNISQEQLAKIYGVSRTVVENSIHGTRREMLRAGWVSGGQARPGETNPAAKLTQKQADEIRARHACGDISQVALGKIYGVWPSTISDVVNGVTFKHR